MMEYDSKADTLLHIKRVAQLLTEASIELIRRANVHDDSKLESPEKELFDEFTPKLKDCTYGSDEYKGYLKGLKVALDHHYACNSHHPEHYKNGINGFDLFDLIEMFFDWKAATERHADGDIMKSIEINKERFGISDQLAEILNNTAIRLGYSKDYYCSKCGRQQEHPFSSECCGAIASKDKKGVYKVLNMKIK
jgi:hypothetical protein